MSRLLGLVLFLSVAFAQAQDASIRIGGSTTALPIISSCAAHFMEKFGSWDKADASLKNDQAVVYVTGGGSGFGVKGLMNGTIDLGMVSRDLKGEETKALGGPVQHVFARDAVAIATNKTNPLAKTKQSGFTIAELAAIFSGQTAQFSQIDNSLPAKPMVLLARDASGGVDRNLPGPRDEAAALRRLAPAVPLHGRAHQEARDERRGDRLHLGGGGEPGQRRAHLRGRRRRADAGEHRQRQVFAQPADADRRQAQPEPQGAALHGLRARRLPGHRQGDGIRPGARR